MFDAIHHVAIICSDIVPSKAFYLGTLGFTLINEEWRAARHSWKCDLVHGSIRLELFTFEESPARPTRPEAIGLRHLAFPKPTWIWRLRTWSRPKFTLNRCALTWQLVAVSRSLATPTGYQSSSTKQRRTAGTCELARLPGFKNSQS